MTKNHVKKIGLQHVSFVTCCNPQKNATKKIITILLRILLSIFLLTTIIKLKIYKGFKLSLCRGFVGESFPHDVRPLRDHAFSIPSGEKTSCKQSESPVRFRILVINHNVDASPSDSFMVKTC